MIFHLTLFSSVSSNSSLSASLYPIASSRLFGTGVEFLLLIWASNSAPDSFCEECGTNSGLSGKFFTSSYSLVPAWIMFFTVGFVIGVLASSEATFTNYYYPYFLGA